MKIVLFLLCLSTILLANGITLKYKVEVDGYYDSNIGQNITEESSLYATPSLGLSFLLPVGKSMDILAGGTVTYENYLQKRLATLNTPFILPYVGFRADIGPLTSTLRGRYAAYYSHTFVVAKTSYRLELDNQFRLKRKRYLWFNVGLMYNDYSTNSSDGMRYTTELLFQKRFKKRLLSSVVPFFEGEFNRANSDTASYDQFELGIRGGFDLKILNASVALSAKSKTYGASYEHPHSMELFTPKNKYAIGSLTLSKKIAKRLKISMTGKLRFKDSTNPTMDYDRHTIGLSIRWSDLLFLFDDSFI